ncbi:hypothetical protein DL765_004718 [Monosporascus sp. GIB2]|nr:hypothetical protein DL765_004718 [Monosporascus sp. GIB2]
MTSRVGLAPPVLAPLLPVTGTFALPFALLSSLLSLRVVQYRRADKQPLGDNSAKDAQSLKTNKLFLASRCQTNFVENVPLALIFAAAAELNGGSRRALTGALGSLFVVRVLHSEFGLLREGGMGLGRGIGYFGTLSIQLGLASYAAYLAKGYWGF